MTGISPAVQDSLPGGDLYHHADGSRGVGCTVS